MHNRLKHVTFRIEKEILCKTPQALLTRRFQGQSRDLASQNHGPVPSSMIALQKSYRKRGDCSRSRPRNYAIFVFD